MPPKKVFLNKPEREAITAFPTHIYTEAEMAEFIPKLQTITNVFGYRCHERSSHATALRYYILANTDYTLEDVADLSNIPHDEMVRYMRGFIDMMDHTRRDVTECAKDLARMHKTAMRKLLNFRIPEFDFINVEEAAKYQKIAMLYEEMYIDLSQDMQKLRAGNKTVGGNDHGIVRRAYNEVYNPIDAEKDEFRLDSFCSAFAVPFGEMVKHYENGNLGFAAGCLDDLRNYTDKIKGKTISELPYHMVGSHRYGVNAVINLPQNSNQNEVNLNFLNGDTGLFPGRDECREVIRTTENQVILLHNDKPRDNSALLDKAMMEPALSLLPDDAPEDLSHLPKETKDALEECYHRTFDMLYSGANMLAAYDSGLTAFDLIRVGDRSINEIVGNKYDNLSPEEQVLAKKMEVFRALKNNPEGVRVYYVTYTIGVNGVVASLNEQYRTVHPKADSLNIVFTLRDSNKLTIQEAEDFLNNPSGVSSGKTVDVAKNVKETFDQVFPAAKIILDRHKMDIYDCIYIGDETVNEIYARKYEAGNYSLKSKDDIDEFKNRIIAAESFHSAKEIFVTLPKERGNGDLEYSIVPVTFSGTGIEFEAGQQRTNTVARVKEKAQEILDKRNEFYRKREQAEKDILEQAKNDVLKSMDNLYRKDMEERMIHVETNSKMVSPITNVFLSQVKGKIEELYDEIITASNEYETYRLAAEICNDDVLKARFNEKANQILNTSPLSDYEKYVQGLEYAYGIKPVDGAGIPDEGKLDAFFREKLGYPVLLIPATAELGSSKSYFRPLEITLEMGEDNKLNEKHAEDLVHAVYTVANAKTQAAGGISTLESMKFGNLILIDGQPAHSLLSEMDAEKDLSRPENTAPYEKNIGKLVATALKQGKNVDFYVKKDGIDTTSLSATPISIKSSRPVNLSANERNGNAARQYSGHIRMIENRNVDETAEAKFREALQRQEQNKEAQFRELVSDYMTVMPDSSFDLTSTTFRSKYYPNGYPVAGNRPNPDPNAPTGEIRPGRAFPANYVFARLIHESRKRKEENKEPYTLEEIFNPDLLTEEKKKYTEEFTRLCRENDTVTFNRNLVDSVRSAVLLYKELNSPEEIARSAENFKEAYINEKGYLPSFLVDIKQEMNLGPNRKVQQHYNLMSEAENDEITNFIDQLSKIKSLHSNASEYRRQIFKQPYPVQHEQLGMLLAEEWGRQSMLAYSAVGFSAYKDADLPLANAMDGCSDIMRTDVMRQFLRNSNLAATIIGNNELFKHIFIDVDAYYAAKDSGEPFNANDFIVRLDPAHPEVGQQLERDALNRRIDRIEKEGFDARLLENLNACRALYGKQPVPEALLQSTDLKKSGEMTAEELNEASRLYDKIFGPIMNRDAVRDYLAANPDKNEFDLLHAGNVTMRAFLGRPAGNPGVPLSPEEVKICKAEAVRLAIDGSVPLSYDVIRKNREGQITVTGKESIINPEITSRVLAERPYLKDVSSFREYAVKNKLFPQGANYSNAEVKEYMQSVMLEAAKNVFSDNRITSLEEMRNANQANPQDYNLAKVQSVFGPKSVFIKDWAEGSADVYDKDQFIKNLPDYETAGFSEREFALLAFLASTNINYCDVKPDIVADIEEDGEIRAFYRDMEHWTDAFMQNNPAPLGDFYLENVIAPARGKASDAIRAFSGENPDTNPMAELIAVGLLREIRQAKKEESILNPEGAFAYHAGIISGIGEVLNKNEDLKQRVEQELQQVNLLEDYKCILKLKELSDKKNNAVKALENKAKGENNLNDNQKEEYYKQISDYNYMAEEWKNNYDAMMASEGYISVKNAADAKKAGVADTRAIAAIEQEKEEYLNENLHISGAIYNYTNPESFNQYKANQNTQISKMQDIRTYLRTQISQYKTAEAVPVTDENGRYNVQPQILIDRAHRMTESAYRITQAINFINTRLTDAMASEIGRKYNLAHPAATKRINNKSQLVETLNLTKISENEFNDLMEDTIAELSMQVYLTNGLKEQIDAIRTPNELLAENIENCITHPLQNRIQELKQNLQDDNLRQMLDEINRNYTKTTEDAKEYLQNYHNLENLVTMDSETAFYSYKQYKNGEFENLTEKASVYPGVEDEKDDYINPEKIESIQRLRQHPTVASENTRRDIALILSKMEEFGMIPPDGNIPFEQGMQKVYAYDKFGIARTALSNAVQSGNMEQIAICNQNFNTEREHIREIMALIKEKFPNAVTTPGNISSLRTGSIPLEFSKDSTTESLMNGLFLLGCQAKRAGVGFREFVDNPVEATFQVNKKQIEKNNIEKYTEHFGTITDAINVLYIEASGGNNGEELTPEERNYLIGTGYELGREHDAPDYQREIYNGPYAAIGYIRPLEVIFALEGDRETRDNMYREFMLTNEVLQSKTTSESKYFKVFEDDINNNYPNEFKERFIKGLKAAIIEGGKLSRRHLPVFGTDENGVKKEDTLDYQRALNTKDRYGIITQTFNANLVSLKYAKGGVIMMKRAMEESLFDYLKAHPEDMQKREYKNLETLALSAGKKLGTQTTLAADYLQYKENFNQKITDLQSSMQKQEEAFKKEAVELQKQLNRANRELTRAGNRHQNTAELERNVLAIENKIKDLADNRILELTLDYKRQKMTQTYLKDRVEQLNALKNNPRNTDYLNMPHFISNNPAERAKDCRLISNIVNKKIWPDVIRNMPERFKDVKSFQYYKLHLKENRTVNYKDELSKEEWKNAYQSELLTYIDENVPLPDGVPERSAILQEMENRHEMLSRRRLDDALLDTVPIQNAPAGHGVIENGGPSFADKMGAFDQNLNNNFASYLKVANVADANDVFPADSYKQCIYDDIADLIVTGIAENRGGRVPGGIQAFKNQIANDVQFKTILIPILDEVKNEAAAPVAEGAQQRHDWRALLISMIKDRTLVNAYSEQKKNPEVQGGLSLIGNAVNANRTEIYKAIQAANRAANPQAGGNNNNPQAGNNNGPQPHPQPAGPHM